MVFSTARQWATTVRAPAWRAPHQVGGLEESYSARAGSVNRAHKMRHNKMSEVLVRAQEGTIDATRQPHTEKGSNGSWWHLPDDRLRDWQHFVPRFQRVAVARRTNSHHSRPSVTSRVDCKLGGENLPRGIWNAVPDRDVEQTDASLLVRVESATNCPWEGCLPPRECRQEER